MQTWGFYRNIYWLYFQICFNSICVNKLPAPSFFKPICLLPVILWLINIVMWAFFIYLVGIFASVNLTFWYNFNWLESQSTKSKGHRARVLFSLPLLLFALQSLDWVRPQGKMGWYWTHDRSERINGNWQDLMTGYIWWKAKRKKNHLTRKWADREFRVTRLLA